MQIRSIKIKNFRGLENIQTDFNSCVNVIVGPNAVGKTTILEAIRLAKALTAPRTQNEATQVLISLGALNPHAAQRLIIEAVARDPSTKVEIQCTYHLTDAEIGSIENGLSKLATNLVQAQIGQAFANPGALVAFLSSPQAKQQIEQAESQLRAKLESIKTSGVILGIRIDPESLRIESIDAMGASFFAFLDQQLAPSETIFSYFSADRALPHGEQPIQLGAADVNNQLESHNSQPQIKFNRLKNTIFSAVVVSEDQRKTVENEFNAIFDGILRGRRFKGVNVNQHGLLSIAVQDVDNQRVFDLDRLSSGEKGIVLTFFTISRTMASGGIVLFDEPELHLNPSVCRDLLSFLVNEYALKGKIQIIICTHSPEILAGAIDNDSCALYHLTSSTSLARVLKQDDAEVAEALRRLGTSESDGLLYKARIFVEGADDVELLRTGFGSLLRRYKLIDLGGRGEIEKQIMKLQEAESKGKAIAPVYFIFDRDESVTKLADSAAIHVLQWSRYCLENYLIDVDVIGALLQSKEYVVTPLKTQGDAAALLKRLAMCQIDGRAAKSVYAEMNYQSPGLRMSEIKGASLNEIADGLCHRLVEIKMQLSSLEEASWKSDFIKKCEEKKGEIEKIWDSNWLTECSGKQLFSDLQTTIQLKCSLLKFKRDVLMRMSQTPPKEGWSTIETHLKRLLGNETA